MVPEINSSVIVRSGTYLQDAVIERGIQFLLLLTPLAFGAVQEWASAVMEVVSFLVLATWLSKVSVTKVLSVRDIRILLPIVGCVSYVVLQLAPIPLELLGILAPKIAEVHRVLGSTNDTAWKTLSLHPWATMHDLWRLLAYTSIFIVVINHYDDRKRVTSLINGILFVAVVLVFLAVLQKATWNGKVLWVYSTTVHTEASRNTLIWGPFINRNHFAGSLEMAVPLAFGMFYYEILKLGHDWKNALKRMFIPATSSARSRKALLYGSISLMLATCLFATLSRGGIVALLSSLAFFIILTGSRRALRRSTSLIIAMTLILLAIIVAAGWDRIESRFSDILNESSINRLRVWQDASNIVLDYQLFGTGLGTFANVYPQYQTHGSNVNYEHAHNEYVELIVELGILGFTCLALTSIVFVVVVYRQWKKRHRTHIKVLGAAAMASVVGMCVHNMYDFNLHVPANAILLCTIAAISYSIVFLSDDATKERT